MTIDYVSCLSRLMFRETKDGGSGEAKPPRKAERFEGPPSPPIIRDYMIR